MQLVFQERFSNDVGVLHLLTGGVLLEQVPSEFPRSCSLCGKAVSTADDSYNELPFRMQDRDSAFHVFECLLMASGRKDKESATQRLALRALARVLGEQKSGSPSVRYFFEHRRTFQDLVTHADEIDESEVAAFRECGDDIRRLLLRHGHSVPIDLIIETMQRLAVNSHTAGKYSDEGFLILGQAVYVAGSKTDHTCEFQSNYIQMFDGNRLIFKALNDFSLANSLELRCHYMPLNFSYTVRQRVLQSTYYFKCECGRCVREAPVPQDQNLDALETLYHDTISPAAGRLLTSLESRFDDVANTNFHKHMLLTTLFLRGSFPDVERMYELGTSALEGCQRHFDRIRILQALCQGLALCGANQPANKHYGKFKSIQESSLKYFTYIHGEGHRLVREIAALGEQSTESENDAQPACEISAMERGTK